MYCRNRTGKFTCAISYFILKERHFSMKVYEVPIKQKRFASIYRKVYRNSRIVIIMT